MSTVISLTYVFISLIPIILGLTIYSVFSTNPIDFSLKIPHLSIGLLVQFLFSILLHELGHFAVAKLLKSQVTGAGFAFKACLPQVFIRVDEPSKRKQRVIAAGGPIVNFIFALLMVALAWGSFSILKLQKKEGVSLQKNSNSFKKFDSLTELAGQKIVSKQQFKELIGDLKQQFFKDQYILLDQEHEIGGDTQPNTHQKY